MMWPKRLWNARLIMGPREDVVVDPLIMPVGAINMAGVQRLI